MGMLDGLLGQLAGNVDIKNLAAKIGLTPEQVESAVQALGVAHTEPGDTAATVAAGTGLSIEKIQEIIAQIGGEGALAQFASLLGESKGGIGGALGGLAGSLVGNKG